MCLNTIQKSNVKTQNQWNSSVLPDGLRYKKSDPNFWKMNSGSALFKTNQPCTEINSGLAVFYVNGTVRERNFNILSVELFFYRFK